MHINRTWVSLMSSLKYDKFSLVRPRKFRQIKPWTLHFLSLKNISFFKIIFKTIPSFILSSTWGSLTQPRKPKDPTQVSGRFHFLEILKVTIKLTMKDVRGYYVSVVFFNLELIVPTGRCKVL